MTTTTPPTYRTGKICYLEIPAVDVQQSAEFYRQVFGWTIRRRGDGATAFDDTVDEVSGAWVLDRPPATAPGLMVYIMVGDAAAAVEAVLAAGGEIVRRIDPNASEVFAWFWDSAGNVLGIYQQAGWPRLRQERRLACTQLSTIRTPRHQQRRWSAARSSGCRAGTARSAATAIVGALTPPVDGEHTQARQELTRRTVFGLPGVAGMGEGQAASFSPTRWRF